MVINKYKEALIRGTRTRATRFGYACFKTGGKPNEGDEDDDDGGDDDEEDGKREANKKALLKEIRAMVKTTVDKKLSEQEQDEETEKVVKQFKDLPDDFLRGLADPKTGILEIIKKQGEKISELEKRGAFNEPQKDLKTLVTEWHTANKTALADIRSGTRRDLTKMDIRAVAAPMTTATVVPGGSPYIPRPFIEPGINEILRVQPTFWDSLRKGRTNAESYVWVNKTNPQGAAAFIGPGVLKPGVSFSLATDISHAKKIAVSAKAAKELLDDIDGMVDMIQGEMRYALLHELNAKLMTGTVSATVPAGIQTLATTYTLTTLKTPNPNYMDALRAAVAQLRSGLLVGRAVIYIHPIDAAQMDLTKATTSGTYLLPPFVTADGRIIAGATVIEDLNIAQGHFLAALIDYYIIKIYEDYNVSQGWENDDFTRNLVTWVAEMRLHQIFNQAYTGAFIYDTFAAVITALTPA